MKNDYFNSFEKNDFAIVEDMELDVEKRNITTMLETYFDADKKLGINTRDFDGVWVNMYALYNPFGNDLRIIYYLDADDMSIEREYIPTDEEKKTITELLEENCHRKYNEGCREFYISEYVNNYMDYANFICEKDGGGIRIRNLSDDFVLYKSDDSDLARFVGDEIEVAVYGDGWCYSIESMDKCEVIYSTDIENEAEESDDMEMG